MVAVKDKPLYDTGLPHVQQPGFKKCYATSIWASEVTLSIVGGNGS